VKVILGQEPGSGQACRSGTDYGNTRITINRRGFFCHGQVLPKEVSKTPNLFSECQYCYNPDFKSRIYSFAELKRDRHGYIALKLLIILRLFGVFLGVRKAFEVFRLLPLSTLGMILR
jgi:hypothetical protein